MVETRNSSVKESITNRCIPYKESLVRVYGFLTGHERIIKETYRDKSSTIAQFVVNRYQLRESWFLDQSQVNLFETHFATYYLAKHAYELHSLMQNPLMDKIRLTPLLSVVPKIYNCWDRCNAEVIQEYRDSAKEQAREMDSTGRPGFLQNAANWLSNVYLQNENSPVLCDRQMKDTISSLL
ncbi:MAG: hypothetical protein Q7R97_03945 [Candidatus Daviesbacteria bacterium]|nr:hypothetical protein [Candidatus Daviesbacteria bacterium]